jgi:crossover junction endodeoxyribonuclease RuvC
LIEVSGARAVLLDAGTIRTKRSSPLPDRLLELYDGLLGVIDTFRPCMMGMEAIYSHYAHPATAIVMGHARGVLCLAAASRGVPVTTLPATMVKKLVVGNGRAGKEQVAGMVRHLLGIRSEVKPADVTDALAMAIAVMEYGGR